MAPLIIGADPIGAEALMIRLDSHLQGHPYAKSPIDMALWDPTAQAATLPLYQFLGRARPADMPLSHSITCIAPDEMALIASDAYQQGIRQFQVKLGADQDIMGRQCQSGRNIIRQKPSQRLAERNGRAAGRFQRV